MPRLVDPKSAELFEAACGSVRAWENRGRPHPHDWEMEPFRALQDHLNALPLGPGDELTLVVNSADWGVRLWVVWSGCKDAAVLSCVSDALGEHGVASIKVRAEKFDDEWGNWLGESIGQIYYCDSK